MQIIAELTVRMARENPRWGYTRIQGALKNVGHRVCRTTIANIMRENGIDPAPERGKRMTWSQFLKAHWNVLAAADFFTVEVWTLTRGLVTYYVFFAIQLRTRRITILPPMTNPNAFRMKHIALELTAFDDSFLLGFTHLIIDRDSKYTAEFRDILRDGGVEPVFIPPKAPNCNAVAERFVRSAKSECTDRMIWFGESALRRGLGAFEAHYLAERNHQGLSNTLIELSSAPP